MNKTLNSYKKSGVDISLANKLVKHIAKISKKNVKKKGNQFLKKGITVKKKKLLVDLVHYTT